MLSAEARAWLNLDQEGDFQYEDAAARLEVQRTDDNEVRIGVQLRGEEGNDEATIYLTVSEAGRLAHMLGVAVLANEAAAHEAASL